MTEPKPRRTEKPQARLGRALGQHMSDDFDAFGAELIAKLRTDRPADYLKLMQSILAGAAGKDAPRAKPKQFTVVERRIIRPEDPEY